MPEFRCRLALCFTSVLVTLLAIAPDVLAENMVATSTGEPRTGLGQRCEITLGITDEASFGGVVFLVDYSGAGGSFLPTAGGEIDCTAENPEVDAAFNDVPASQVLTVGMVKADGFAGPQTLGSCVFNAVPIAPLPTDFAISILDAVDLTGVSVDPPPTIEITAVSCRPHGTTTSSSTSTSTVSVTSTSIEPVTTTLPVSPGTLCLVTFRMMDRVLVDAIQFDVDYSDSDSVFVGDESSVACDKSDAFRLGNFNHLVSDKVLRAAFVSSSEGQTGPYGLMHCSLLSGFVSPRARDFKIRVTDASDPGFEPILPRPLVSVASIQCPASSATTTTLFPTTTTSTTTTVSSTTSSTTTTMALPPSCGRPLAVGIKSTARDALYILRAAIDLEACQLCLCDTDGSGSITAADARRALLVAVDLDVALNCPAC